MCVCPRITAATTLVKILMGLLKCTNEYAFARPTSHYTTTELIDLTSFDQKLSGDDAVTTSCFERCHNTDDATQE